MALRLGDTAPDFTAETNEGRIDFHQWLGNGWGILFSHPKDYTPVCTTELGTVAKMKSEFGKVLLWDCHSIRQVVPTIQKEGFPDFILGSADGRSAANDLIQTALRKLGSEKYTLEHNHPFKGGYITRHYGRTADRQHALQLEMTKINYMDDAQIEYHPSRADKIGRLLRTTLKELGESLIIHKD